MKTREFLLRKAAADAANFAPAKWGENFLLPNGERAFMMNATLTYPNLRFHSAYPKFQGTKLKQLDLNMSTHQ